MIRWIKKHKYKVTLLFFIVWMLFFDRNNYFEIRKLKKELKALKAERSYYQTELETAQNDYNDLFTNKENLERFAREKYLMKKENEDIFVVVAP